MTIKTEQNLRYSIGLSLEGRKMLETIRYKLGKKSLQETTHHAIKELYDKLVVEETQDKPNP